MRGTDPASLIEKKLGFFCSSSTKFFGDKIKMKMTQALLIAWLTGWLVSSIAYVVSEKKKAESAGREFSLKKALSFVPNLFILWPFTLVLYVCFRTNITKRMNDKQ